VKASKEEIGKVHFELQLHISKLQLKLQPTTVLKVREYHEVVIKEEMATLQAAFKGYIQLFENAMELWTSPQEDPNL